MMFHGASASIAAIILGSASFAVPGCTLLRTDGFEYHVPGNKPSSHGQLISIDRTSEALMHATADELSMRMSAAVGCSMTMTKHESISRSVWKWAQSGLPSEGRVNVELSKYNDSITLAWLMSETRKYGRSHIHMWNLCAFLAAKNVCGDLKEFNHTRHQQRVVLGGLSIGVRRSIQLNSLDTELYFVLCECVQASIWSPEKFLEAKSGVYFMWAHQQRILEESVRIIWLNDVGVKKEEEGHNMLSIHASICFECDKMQLALFNPNILIANGLVPEQTFARFEPFRNSHLCHYHTLRTSLLVQVAGLDHLSGGTSEGLYLNSWYLSSVVVVLGWPQKWVHKALCSGPRRQFSTPIFATRFMGRVFKLHDWLDIGHLLDHFCAQNRMSKSQISHAIDNHSQLLDPQGSVVLANSLAMDANSDEGKREHEGLARGMQGNRGEWNEYQQQLFRENVAEWRSLLNNREAHDSKRDEIGQEDRHSIQEDCEKKIAKKGSFNTMYTATATQELQWHLIAYRYNPGTTLSRTMTTTTSQPCAEAQTPTKEDQEKSGTHKYRHRGSKHHKYHRSVVRKSSVLTVHTVGGLERKMTQEFPEDSGGAVGVGISPLFGRPFAASATSRIASRITSKFFGQLPYGNPERATQAGGPKVISPMSPSLITTPAEAMSPKDVIGGIKKLFGLEEESKKERKIEAGEEKFQLMRKITRWLLRRDTDENDEGMKEVKEKEKKESKVEEEKEERDKDADLKKAPGAFLAPFHPAEGAGSSSNAKTVVEAKELFRQSLLLKDRVTIDELSDPEWLEVIIMRDLLENARQADLKRMAGLNNTS